MVYRAALFFGIAPLVVGTGVYVLYLFTRWDSLIGVGGYTMAGGMASVLAGIGCLVYDVAEQSMRGKATRPQLRRRALAAGVLALNPPVGFLMLLLGSAAMTLVTVTFHNDSAATVTRFALSAPGLASEWVEIAPGESRSVDFRFAGDGTLTYEAEVAGTQYAGPLEDYVTNGEGGVWEVRLQPDSTFVGYGVQ